METNVVLNVLLPVTSSEWFAALPPRHHTPGRHLGLALDECVSSHLHQCLAPQLVVREIWGNSWDNEQHIKARDCKGLTSLFRQ